MGKWREYGKWVKYDNRLAYERSQHDLLQSIQRLRYKVSKHLPDEESGTILKINGEYVWAIRPVIEIEDNKMSNIKVKSYLAQEFRDLKARLSKKSFKDNKPKSQREVWLTGLSSIKDSLTRFKDFPPKFEESKHKRDKDGKFSTTGGGGKNAKEESSENKPKSESGKPSNAAILFHLAGKDKDFQKAWNAGIDLNDLEDEDISEEDKDLYNQTQERINRLNDKVLKQGGKLKKEDKKECAEIASAASYILGEDDDDDDDEDYEDSARYVNDRKIDIKRDGKLIDVVNAETLDEAVRIYERQHPELRGQIDAYFSDGKVEDARIGFDKDWAERMFNAGYTARETAMRVKGYQESENPDEQRTLISELEQLRKAYFERKKAEKRSMR